MGNNRDLFKKVRESRGIFHAKMGTMKDRNSMDLTETEDIKKRWQEYTEKLYKNDLHSEVKWIDAYTLCHLRLGLIQYDRNSK